GLAGASVATVGREERVGAVDHPGGVEGLGKATVVGRWFESARDLLYGIGAIERGASSRNHTNSQRNSHQRPGHRPPPCEPFARRRSLPSLLDPGRRNALLCPYLATSVRCQRTSSLSFVANVLENGELGIYLSGRAAISSHS